MAWSGSGNWSAGPHDSDSTPYHRRDWYTREDSSKTWAPGQSWGSQAHGSDGDRHGQGTQPYAKGSGATPDEHRGTAGGYRQPNGKGHGGKADFQQMGQQEKGIGGGGYADDGHSQGGNASGFFQQQGNAATQHGWKGQADDRQTARGSGKGYPNHVGDTVYNPRADQRGQQTRHAHAPETPPDYGFHLDGQVDNSHQQPRLVEFGMLKDMAPWNDGGHARSVMTVVRRVFYKVHRQTASGEPLWPCVHNPYQHEDIKPISVALTWVGRATQLRLENDVQLFSVRHMVGALWPFVNFVKEFQRLHPDHPERNGLYTFSDELKTHRYMFQPNSHYTIALVLLYVSQYDTQAYPGSNPHFEVLLDDSLPDTDPKKIQVWVRPGSDTKAWENKVALKMLETVKTPAALPPRPASRLLRRWALSACRESLRLLPLDS